MMKLLAIATALLLATPAMAADWEILATPYFMAPTSDGKFGVGAQQTAVSSSPSDLFSKLNWGIMGSVEANNGDWGFNLDVNYLNVDVTNDDIRRFSVNGHQSAYTAVILKRIHRNAEIYGGVKISSMGVRLDCNNVCPVPLTNPADRQRTRTWGEPVIGLRTVLPFNERLDLTVMADVGGFRVGSDISVNAWPQLGWRISESAKAMLGYRVIYVKYDEGEGRERFLYDAVTYGPTLGIEFRF